MEVLFILIIYMMAGGLMVCRNFGFGVVVILFIGVIRLVIRLRLYVNFIRADGAEGIGVMSL